MNSLDRSSTALECSKTLPTEFILTDKEKAKQIGQAGKNYVIEKHDIKNNIKLLEKIYEDI